MSESEVLYASEQCGVAHAGGTEWVGAGGAFHGSLVRDARPGSAYPDEGPRPGGTEREDRDHEARARDWRLLQSKRCTARLRDAQQQDAQLWQLAHLESQADRQLARGLAELWDNNLFEPLGFVRATDFVAEYLGIHASRARWLAKLGRTLLEVPELDRALAERRLTASHVVELRAIVGSTTPVAERLTWIERAATMTVRALRRAVKEEVRARREASAEEQAASGSAQSDADDDATADKAADDQVPNDDSKPEVMRIDLTADGTDDDRPDGAWVSIDVPLRLALLWQDALELARVASGRQLSRGQCAEFIFAEYLSAVGDDDPEETARLDEEQRRRQREQQVRALFREAERGNHRFSMRKHLRRQREDALQIPAEQQWPAIDWQLPAGDLPADCHVEDLYPWTLAKTLLALCQLKTGLRLRLAAGLERVHGEALWNELRFDSFTEYCERRLGFGVRRAQLLLRFRDKIKQYPVLERAHLKGEISYSAAQQLLQVIEPSTERLWVEWADGLTYREIERVVEIADCYALAGAVPSVFTSYLRELAAKGFVQQRSDRAGHETEETKETEGQGDANAFAAGGAVEGHPATAFVWNEPGAEAQPDCHDTEQAGSDTEQTDHDPRDTTDIPLGCPIPPTTQAGSPTIVGIPDDLELLDPEVCLARIRFWAPRDVVDMIYHVIRRARNVLSDPARATWTYAEVIIVHFIHSQDTPAAREVIRRHKTIARDRFQCTCPACTSRSNLHGHHIHFLSQGGSDEEDNLTTLCAGHHLRGVHGTSIVVGGRAPHDLIVKLGIDPRSGRALLCYRRGRRVSEEEANAALAEWRETLRGNPSGDPAP